MDWKSGGETFMEPDKTALHRRVLGLRLLLAGLFFILVARLWELQILHGAEYENQAWKNRIRPILTPVPRGVIYAAGGEILATNRAAYCVTILPCQLSEPDRELRRLAEIIGLDGSALTLIRRDLKAGSRRPFRSFVVKADVDLTTLTGLEEELRTLPGVLIENRPVRFYPFGSLAAHLVGHVGEVDANQLERYRSPEYMDWVRERYGPLLFHRFKQQGVLQYAPGDIIGRAGIERHYDEFLQGWGGGQRVVVNAREEVVEALSPEPVTPGSSLYLTLDLELQRVAEEALQDQVGAIAVVDPRNGKVRALASSPTFDPNVFVHHKGVQEVLNHPLCPLLNRALCAYPPASTFKLVTALAALQNGAISSHTTVYCRGGIRRGRWFRCWRRHGRVNLLSALSGSCDVFFYLAAEKVGPEALQSCARDFGLGEESGLDVPWEKSGRIPTEEWMRTHHGRKWYPGDTFNMSIGQGDVEVTPLQMALVAAAVANGGKLYQPQLVERIVDGEGKEVYSFQPKLRRRVDVSQEHLEMVRQGMKQAVNGPGGTGRGVRIPGITVAGKTGSAETQGDAHAWFVSFAPYDHPRLACAVLVEHGKHGSEAAVPPTRKIYQAYFGSQVPPSRRAAARTDRLGRGGRSPGGSVETRPAPMTEPNIRPGIEG